jgi:hypothetical protein
MKGNPAMPGGPLTSKPAWLNTSGYSTMPAFFSLALAGGDRNHERDQHDEQSRINRGATNRASGNRFLEAWSARDTVILSSDL